MFIWDVKNSFKNIEQLSLQKKERFQKTHVIEPRHPFHVACPAVSTVWLTTLEWNVQAIQINSPHHRMAVGVVCHHTLIFSGDLHSKDD